MTLNLEKVKELQVGSRMEVLHEGKPINFDITDSGGIVVEPAFFLDSLDQLTTGAKDIHHLYRLLEEQVRGYNEHVKYLSDRGESIIIHAVKINGTFYVPFDAHEAALARERSQNCIRLMKKYYPECFLKK